MVWVVWGKGRLVWERKSGWDEEDGGEKATKQENHAKEQKTNYNTKTPKKRTRRELRSFAS